MILVCHGLAGLVLTQHQTCKTGLFVVTLVVIMILKDTTFHFQVLCSTEIAVYLANVINENRFFPTCVYFAPPLTEFPWNWVSGKGLKTRVMGLYHSWCQQTIYEIVSVICSRPVSNHWFSHSLFDLKGGASSLVISMPSGRPHNPTSRFWSSQTSVVTAESFSDRSGPL